MQCVKRYCFDVFDTLLNILIAFFKEFTIKKSKHLERILYECASSGRTGDGFGIIPPIAKTAPQSS